MTHSTFPTLDEARRLYTVSLRGTEGISVNGAANYSQVLFRAPGGITRHKNCHNSMLMLKSFSFDPAEAPAALPFKIYLRRAGGDMPTTYDSVIEAINGNIGSDRLLGMCGGEPANFEGSFDVNGQLLNSTFINTGQFEIFIADANGAAVGGLTNYDLVLKVLLLKDEAPCGCAKN